MNDNFDLIVIGGGPAGCAAATFAARSRWQVLVIDQSLEQGFLGGLGNVSYFPGFPEAITGEALVQKMHRQAELVGVHFLTDRAAGIAVEPPQLRITTDGGKEFRSKAVVIATGAATRTNYLPGEREFLGRGVSFDAVADGPAVSKRTIAVIGKSRHAAEEALVLTRFAEKIHFIIPSNRLESDDTLFHKVQRMRTVELHFSTSLKKINGTDHVSSITVFTGGQEKDIPVVGVFSYVHEYRPTTTFLEKTLELSANGSVKVDENLSTNVEGVFACGDVLCARPQIPAISAAQGLLAGINIDKFLCSRR